MSDNGMVVVKVSVDGCEVKEFFFNKYDVPEMLAAEVTRQCHNLYHDIIFHVAGAEQYKELIKSGMK